MMRGTMLRGESYSGQFFRQKMRLRFSDEQLDSGLNIRCADPQAFLQLSFSMRLANFTT
jgi:hypothetical protein